MKKLTVITCAMMVMFAVTASAMMDVAKTIKGEIQNIQENNIAVISQEADETTAIQIKFTEETVFEETTAANTLVAGDMVEIEYKLDNEENIALFISRVAAEEQLMSKK